MQSLKQKDSSLKEYTKEFYKLDIGFGHLEDEVESVSRYLNGLRNSIQEEIVWLIWGVCRRLISFPYNLKRS